MLKRLFALFIALIFGLILAGQAAAQGPITPRHTDPAWQASYWNNPHLSGSPVLQRSESELDHDWGWGSPDSRVSSDQFSARWTRYFDVPPGNYRFTATSDDGIRVWVDGTPIINQWYDHGTITTSANRYLGSGHHLVVVEYYENGGEAVAKLSLGPAESPIQNWRGEYFNNIDLSGAPALIRDDAKINFDWGNGSPAPGPIGVDWFSVRWTRSVNFPAGSYRFRTTVDDGVRLWVNNHLLIDAWRDQSPTSYTGDIYLPGGSVPVKMEYFEKGSGAVAKLSWTKLDAPAPPPPPSANTGWFGQYYANRNLAGAPAFTRRDSEVRFDWGNGSPASGFPADNFSVRWTQNFYLEWGYYTLYAHHDDGVRVWLDGDLVIDSWHDQPATTHKAVRYLNTGPHRVQIEFYEHGGQASTAFWMEWLQRSPRPKS